MTHSSSASYFIRGTIVVHSAFGLGTIIVLHFYAVELVETCTWENKGQKQEYAKRKGIF